MRIIVIFLFCLLIAGPSHAGTRDRLFYQGYAVDSGGRPLRSTLSVTFRIYEASEGGSSLWEEAQDISFSDGLFTATLGGSTAFPSDLFEKSSLYLAVKIAEDNEMTPRLSFSSVPFAQRAQVATVAETLATTLSIAGSQIASGAISSAKIATGAIGPAELASTSVSSGTYSLSTITVDADGRITSASSGTQSLSYSDTLATNSLGAGQSAFDSGDNGGQGGILFEGLTANGFEGLLTVADPTAADRTWTLPDVTGTIVTTGDTGSVTAAMINDGTITTTDISSTAGITDAQVSDTLTASTLGANGANCSAGSYPLGVDAAGAVESCTVAATGSVTSVATGTGLTGGTISTTGTVALKYTETLAGNPTLTGGQAVFDSGDGGGGILFEGLTATSNDFEGLLTVADPTADRTWTLPDVTGTIVTTGDTESVTATMITNGTITTTDISNSAGITDAQVSDTLTASIVVGSGSTTDAVDLATAEAAGTLTVAKGGTGVTTSTGTGNVVLSASPTLTGTVAAASATFSGRIQGNFGANVTSAGDMTLGTDGNIFSILGATTINGIAVAGWQNGSIIVLYFTEAVTVKNNTTAGTGFGQLRLSAGADFSATGNDTLTLFRSGDYWWEMARTAIP